MEVAESGVDCVHVSDVDVGLWVSSGIVRNGEKLLRLVQKYLGDFIDI